jgi:mannose-6-phosphate isomerase class I
LDTFDGGNLSLQCHPGSNYIHEHFGENFTQDETYYILDAGDTAKVYLGFQKNIDPDEFKQVLENSHLNNEKVNVSKFIQVHDAKKHDLFLIPNGTAHCSGINNLVLEISATPYIFTFKMYDWLRLDMDGKLRPLNIDRAFENLDFDRRGARAIDELISVPELLKRGSGYEIWNLPTHDQHFYSVHRLEFESSIDVVTENQCHVMSLVEGTRIRVDTAGGGHCEYNYAETFVVPAATESYRITNLGEGKAKVIQAYVKPDHC